MAGQLDPKQPPPPQHPTPNTQHPTPNTQHPTPANLELLTQHLGEEIKLLSNFVVVLGPEVKKAGACKNSHTTKRKNRTARPAWSAE